MKYCTIADKINLLHKAGTILQKRKKERRKMKHYLVKHSNYRKLITETSLQLEAHMFIPTIPPGARGSSLGHTR
jgi:hypothetical protein